MHLLPEPESSAFQQPKWALANFVEPKGNVKFQVEWLDNVGRILKVTIKQL